MIDDDRVVVLAHDRFPDDARAAIGLMDYGSQEIVAVLDRARRSPRTSNINHTFPTIPIVKSFEDVDEEVDRLIVGIATSEGFEESWRADVRAALRRGCEVVAGDGSAIFADPELSELASETDGRLVDAGAPSKDLTASTGRAGAVDADVILTVGTDRYVGTSTATLEIVAAAREAGIDATAVPTSRVGATIEEWGIDIERVSAGLVSGAVESLVCERGGDHELLVVEGHGSIVHPGTSSVACGLLHGAMPEGLVVCHAHERGILHGFDVDVPPIERYVELYEGLAEPVSESPVVAGALHTGELVDDEEARSAIEAFSERLDTPATDPVRFDAGAIVEAFREA